MLTAVSACGAKNTETDNLESNLGIVSEDIPGKKDDSTSHDDSSLETILFSIESDYTNTIQNLKDSFEEAKTSIGNTYQEYLENKQLLSDWYLHVLEEETALFERTKVGAVEYFKLISSSIEHSDSDAIDDAMEKYYDFLYDDLMDNFYDEIYDDLMDEVYETYYDGIVEEGYEIDPYAKWLDESSACYKEWLDTSSSIYKTWLDYGSIYYGYWLDVSSGFFNNNFDIESIILEYENNKIEQAEEALEQKTEEETPATTTYENDNSKEDTSNSYDGIRPEFIEAMDSYEAFFDEYVDFMNEYMDADTDEMLDMLDEYSDYMKSYAETMKKFEELENEEMSTEEAIYYLEVANRISTKLLEVEY